MIAALAWPIAILAGLGFWWLARRAGKNPAVWAAGGALLALFVATVMLGLARAAFAPVDGDQTRFWFQAAAIAVLGVVLCGWLFSMPLRRCQPRQNPSAAEPGETGSGRERTGKGGA